MSATEAREMSFEKYKTWLWKICDTDAGWTTETAYRGAVADVVSFLDDRLMLIGPKWPPDRGLPDRQSVYLAHGGFNILDITGYSYRQLFDKLSVVLAATESRDIPDQYECIESAMKDFKTKYGPT